MMYKSLDMSLQIDRQSKKDPIELTVTDKIETIEELHFHVESSSNMSRRDTISEVMVQE